MIQMSLTPEQDASNAIRNVQMQWCPHKNVTNDKGRIWCPACGGTFALVLLPRRAPVLSIEPDDAA